jgi:hypothetical protein
VLAAVAVVAAGTGVARPARLEHLQGDAISLLDAPALAGALPELLHDAHRLVPRDERAAGVELAGVLLVVGAAQAARLDQEEPVVGADLREVERLLHQSAGGFQDQGSGVRRGAHSGVLVTTRGCAEGEFGATRFAWRCSSRRSP